MARYGVSLRIAWVLTIGFAVSAAGLAFVAINAALNGGVWWGWALFGVLALAAFGSAVMWWRIAIGRGEPS